MSRANFLILLIAFALVSGGCRQAQRTTPTSESPGASPAESPATQAQGDECKMISEADVEAIVGTDVTLTEGSCKYEGKDQSKGISGTWSVEEYSDAAWTGAKDGVGGDPQQGYGDEAFAKDSGFLAQMIVKKGDVFLILTTSAGDGKAKAHMLALADKLVAEM